MKNNDQNATTSQVNLNEPQPSAPDAQTEQSDKVDQSTNPVKRTSQVVLLLCLIIFCWYLAADRITPTSSNSRVMGFVVPISSYVSGELVDVTVQNNQPVEKGEILAQIAPDQYQIAVEQAEAELELAGQEIGAGTAGVSAAQARVIEARSQLQTVQTDANRLIAIEDQGVLPQADIDRARNQVSTAKAAVAKAEAELAKAKESLGVTDESNPRIRAALAKLGKARLDLGRTTIVAPADGGVTNLQIEDGYFANVGQPLMTFVTTSQVWIEAYMRENNISNIKAGDPVEVTLDVAPGRIFKGEVTSVGFAISFGQAASPGALPSPPQQTGWLRDPQRFPVLIQFNDDESMGLRRVGAQATITVYTDESSILNPIAKVLLRLQSYLSYIY